MDNSQEFNQDLQEGFWANEDIGINLLSNFPTQNNHIYHNFFQDCKNNVLTELSQDSVNHTENHLTLYDQTPSEFLYTENQLINTSSLNTHFQTNLNVDSDRNYNHHYPKLGKKETFEIKKSLTEVDYKVMKSYTALNDGNIMKKIRTQFNTFIFDTISPNKENIKLLSSGVKEEINYIRSFKNKPARLYLIDNGKNGKKQLIEEIMNSNKNIKEFLDINLDIIYEQFFIGNENIFKKYKENAIKTFENNLAKNSKFQQFSNSLVKESLSNFSSSYSRLAPLLFNYKKINN